ncbi:MAG: class I SAM-dependent methyltransferase [Bacteriovoracaceae bacterium]|nr:class I SAM-dependent methyltransferase [Bacteriovoracaceae bacterium]
MKKGPGGEGFDKEYWDENYAHPEEMDNIGNRKLHLNYLKSFLALEYTDVSSIFDFGFGLGHLFEEALKEFKPYKAYGIEPSETAFKPTAKRLEKFREKKYPSMNLELEMIDLYQWAKKNRELKKIKTFDLGICTSVFQYLSDEEIKVVIKEMSRVVKVLYFSVPTDVELKRQREEVEFYDKYALQRSREKYLELISPHFTFVSNRILESKVFYSEEDTNFSDLLFRF